MGNTSDADGVDATTMARMEFGITSFAETHPDPESGEYQDHGERLRQVVHEVEVAESAGLDVYGLGEHHRPDMAASSPAIVMAAAAGRTEKIRLSSAVVILSSADPVRVYQDWATLDLVSNGRAELLIGRGSFIESFPLFGYSLGDYDELFQEKFELLMQIRDNVKVTWSGRFRSPLDDQGVYPRSQQDPLPIWIGVGGTPASMVRAGHNGIPVNLAIIGGDPLRFRVLADLYRRSLAEAGYDPESVPLAVHAHGHLADTFEQADEEFYPWYQAAMSKIGRERGWPPVTRDQFEWMAGEQGSLLLGTPEMVAEKLTRWRDALGLDRFMLHVAVGNMDHGSVTRTIESLGKDVAPMVNSG
jgi:probable LLM family oxidoreductase